MDTLISGKLLKARGWPEGRIIGLAKAAGEELLATGIARDDVLAQLDAVRERPSEFLGQARFSELARETLRRTQVETSREDDKLRDEPLPFETWGAQNIDAGAFEQMRHSMRLPISVAGALMPDAHIGYGLPIGGVLATQGAVIPYAVGVDIACFSGHTRVPTTGGRDYSLQELAENGEEIAVYACTPTGKIVGARATAHKTRDHTELLRVTLDNGETVRCTPDHEWMRRDGSFVFARDLQPGDSLMPFDGEAARAVESELLVAAGNHKIARVETLAEREDVYCLNVPGLENFALSAGVFVHNCRMRLSIYEVSPHILGQSKAKFEKALDTRTKFGAGSKWTGNDKPQHEVVDDAMWSATKLLKSLQYKASEQLGTSGSGNHFVEWGSFELQDDAPDLGLKAGTYLSLLSHSGSRAIGFKIANVYSQLATALHSSLPPSVARLAWLDLGSEAGEEYWLSMELAGRFASANHAVIHRRVADAAGVKEVASVENHHNFCISGASLVPTPNGPKPMRELRAGDVVYASDSQRGPVETRVLEQWQTGIKATRTLRTRSRALTVTDEHPILTVESGRLRWKAAGEIKVGDHLVCADGYYRRDATRGEAEARLTGAFLGDGWVRHDTSHGRYTVGLAIGDAEQSHTHQYLGLLRRILPTATWNVGAPGAYGLTCASAKVWRTVNDWGVAAYSREKRVPAWAFRLSEGEKLALLSGYVDADGYVAGPQTSNHGRATLCTTNKVLLQELRELALGCGLQVTPVVSGEMKSNFGATIAHRCTLSADSARCLTLWHPVKAGRLRDTMHLKSQGLSRQKLRGLELPPGCFAQRVTGVSLNSVPEPVYDLTVEHPDHAFIVEGVVVHNCWRETLADGSEVLVHRKGATPAGAGVFGVIPGSMGDAGYVVRGRGHAASLNSASHGAGRKMGRRAAEQSLTKAMRDNYLRERGVTLLGGGLDESPQAYKDIEEVMAAQQELVEVVGKFSPKIVKMASEAGDV